MVCYYKVRQLFYYKVRQVLLQSATGITKCDDYYKVRQFVSVLFTSKQHTKNRTKSVRYKRYSQS